MSNPTDSKTLATDRPVSHSDYDIVFRPSLGGLAFGAWFPDRPGDVRVTIAAVDTITWLDQQMDAGLRRPMAS